MEESGDYPFVFEMPDYACHAPLALPRRGELALTAFAHELQCWPDQAAYAAGQGEGPVFAVQSFIPSGLFSAGGEDSEEQEAPRALAIFSGTVLQTCPLQNGLGGAGFVWALVQTLGGTVDVVLDPQLLPPDLAVGSIVRGNFWLSGRLL